MRIVRRNRVELGEAILGDDSWVISLRSWEGDLRNGRGVRIPGERGKRGDGWMLLVAMRR